MAKKLSPRLRLMDPNIPQLYLQTAVNELEKQLSKLSDSAADVSVIEALSEKMIEKGFVTKQDVKDSGSDVISCLMLHIRLILESGATWADKQAKLNLFLDVFGEIGGQLEEVATATRQGISQAMERFLPNTRSPQFVPQTMLSVANANDSNTNSLDDSGSVPGGDVNLYDVKPRTVQDETNLAYSTVCINENKTTLHPGTLSHAQLETTPTVQQPGKGYNIKQNPIISGNFSCSPSVYKRQQSCPDCIKHKADLKEKNDEDKDKRILELELKVNKLESIIECMNKENKQKEKQDKKKFERDTIAFEAQKDKIRNYEERLLDEKERFRIIRNEEETHLRLKRQESEKEKEKYKLKYKKRKEELAKEWKAFEDEKAKSNKELEEKWKKYEERLREMKLEDN